MKILICDDDPMTIRALEYQFKKDGFDVIKTVNGREATKILDASQDIDLIIVDIHMPMMSGFELVTYVRDNLQRETPIIVLSKVNSRESFDEALDLGANDYLTKPFNLEELSTKIKEVLKIS